MARTPGRTTITDVARQAGVSLSTVSRVMNDNATVDAELAERVRAAALALGYTASPLARSLVLGRTQTIAVVVPDLENPTFVGILRGLSRAAADDGYHVLIADSAEQVDEEAVLATQTRRRTDGVVLCAPRMSDAELAALLPTLTPAVVVNRPPQHGTPVVAADYRTAFGGLIDHLHGLGHRRLAYLAGPPRSAADAERRAAVADGLERHPGLEIAIVPGGADFDSGAAAREAVTATGATGVLAFNDLVAMGLLSTLAEADIRVPADLSVTGCDDIPFARYTTPPLTTAAVPTADLGARAWAAMRAQLEGGEADATVSLEPRLVARASTGPAAR